MNRGERVEMIQETIIKEVIVEKIVKEIEYVEVENRAEIERLEAQIAVLEPLADEVPGLKDQIKMLMADIEDVNKAINDGITVITSLTGQVDLLEDRVEELKAQRDEFARQAVEASNRANVAAENVKAWYDEAKRLEGVIETLKANHTLLAEEKDTKIAEVQKKLDQKARDLKAQVKMTSEWQQRTSVRNRMIEERDAKIKELEAQIVAIEPNADLVNDATNLFVLIDMINADLANGTYDFGGKNIVSAPSVTAPTVESGLDVDFVSSSPQAIVFELNGVEYTINTSSTIKALQTSLSVGRAAFEQGFAEGFERGFSEGYDKGYSDGYNDGYKQGFKDGVASVTQ